MAADVLASLSPDENPARADALGAALAQHVAAASATSPSCSSSTMPTSSAPIGAAAELTRRPRSPCP